MDCQFIRSAKDDYLTLSYSGEVNRDTIFNSTLKAHEFGRIHGLKKYLADFANAVNTDTAENTYDFAYINVQQSKIIDKSAIVAILVAPDDHSHDFAETVCRNIGYNVTLFRDRKKAIEYLKKCR